MGFVLEGFGEFLAGNLAGRFDVIGFDPRGVGASDPLHCFDSEEHLARFFADLQLFPYRHDQYRPFFSRFRSLGEECLDDERRIARHMSTADVARDLDLLRRAVGDNGLTYLGFSYGSYLGNTYANLFPNRIRALAIDGVLDARLWTSGRQIESDRIATQEVWNEFLRLCDDAAPECALSSPEGSQTRWEALAEALLHEPLDLGEAGFYTYDLLIGDATSATYAPETWGGPEGFGALFDLIADAVLGDQAAAQAATPLRAGLLALLHPETPEADYPNGLDAYYGNQCADTKYPSSFGVFRLIDRYAAAGSRFGPFWWWQNAGCADWPVAPDRYTGPWSTPTSAPVLVVGNAFDPATDYAGAVATSRRLQGSRLLTYAGWGHTAYGRSACATEFTSRYLIDLSLPPTGTVCPANQNPFLLSSTRATSSTPLLVGLPTPWPGR